MDCITNGGLWRHRDFLKLWTGQTISEMGSRITREGIPLTAVMALKAAPPEMGLLTAAGALSMLIFGLLAGVWVDRLKRRPILILADLGRAAVLVSIPIAAWAGRLTMAQLYVVIAFAGILTVFFDVAYQSYLPSLVERENLLEGNSKLALSSATAEVAGPGLTGVLVQLVTAPMAILVDAASFLFSAAMVLAIRKPEASAARAAAPEHWRAEILGGLRFVFGHPVLRPLACWSVTTYLFYGFVSPLYVLYAIRVLGLRPAALGVAIATGGVGALIGSSLAPRLARTLGLGRVFIGSGVWLGAMFFLIPAAHGPAPLALAFVMAAQLLGDSAGAVFMVNELSLRQSLAPDHMLGRVNAAMQLMSRGVLPFGAVISGFLAGQIGIRPTLLISACGLLASSGWLIFSPVRKLGAEFT